MARVKLPRLFLALGAPIRRCSADDAPPLPKLGDRIYWVKDLLKVGNWHNQAWPDPWNVTGKTIDGIVSGFQLARQSGVVVPVILSDDGDDQHNENGATKVGEVVDVWSEGGALVAKLWTASANDAKVYQLDTQAQQVSVDVREGWEDGNGNKYPWFLKHVAIVTQPVVSGQGPFVRQLSLTQKGGRKMAKEKQAAEGDGEGGGDTFTADEVKEMLQKAGFNIPQEATTKGEVVAAFLALSKPEEAGPEEMAPEAAMNVMDNVAASTPGQLAAALKGVGKAYKAALDTIKTTKAMQLAQAKAAYEGALERHTARGAISEAQRAEWAKVGETVGYQLSILSPVESLPDHATVNTGGAKGKQLAKQHTAAGMDAAAAEKQKGARDFLLRGMGLAK